jgi:hypothetical protein
MSAQTSIGANDGHIQSDVVGASSGPFSVDFPFFSLDDVVVTVVDANGTLSTLVRGVDYALTATANDDGIYPSGEVTLTSPIENSTITRYRTTGLTRASQLPLTGYLDRTALNADLNRQIVSLQDQLRIASSTLRFSEEDGAFDKILPPAVQAANSALLFDANSDPYYGLISDLGGGVASSSFTQTLLPLTSDDDWVDALGWSAYMAGLRTTANLAALQALLSVYTAAETDALLLPLPTNGRRWTVQGGPLTAAGLPDFMAATHTGLQVTPQNLTTTSIRATAPMGWSATTGRAIDRFGILAANTAWTGLTASRAAATPNFLYWLLPGGNVMTPASTIIAPVIQEMGTPSVTAGAITFNIAEMKSYLGNGTTAPETPLVLAGEAATDGSNVISTVAYAYNGQYDSGYTATLPAGGTPVSKNHNIGVVPRIFDFVINCTTTNNGWAVGDEINSKSMISYNGASDTVPCVGASTKTVVLNTSGYPFYTLNKSTGAILVATAASWKYRMTADRGW